MVCGWLLPLVGVMGWVLVAIGAQGGETLCQSSAYRGLPVEVQNEHQCMVLERLQQDAQQHKMQADKHFNVILRYTQRSLV